MIAYLTVAASLTISVVACLWGMAFGTPTQFTVGFVLLLASSWMLAALEELE